MGKYKLSSLMYNHVSFVSKFSKEIRDGHNTTQHNTTQHNTTQHNTTQHNTTQHNTTQHNSTQLNSTQLNSTQLDEWFYEENGQRKGPVSEKDIIHLIKSLAITRDTPVWKSGFISWTKAENTELRAHLDNGSTPPLYGEHINNSIVWALAFAPILGYFLEWVVAGAMHGGNTLAAHLAMADSSYWFVTTALNIVLSFLDEKRLQKAGHNTDKFKGWVWLVPVYLYQRAKATKQNLAYFVVWIVCFVIYLSS